MAEHGLTQAHLAIVRNILVEAGVSLDGVAVFGSRATGRARPNSDIDLVLHGPVAETTVELLRRRFDDSLLPVTVDLHIYDRIAHAPLKAHIDRFGRPLFPPASIIPGADQGDHSPYPA